jgi:hypothetical protein
MDIHKLYDELNPQLLKDIVYIKVKELEILALRQLRTVRNAHKREAIRRNCSSEKTRLTA